jgi:hypothetical protein
VTLESDDLEELTREIRRLIESNRLFLARVGDDEYEDEAGEPEPDDCEEL